MVRGQDRRRHELMMVSGWDACPDITRADGGLLAGLADLALAPQFAAVTLFSHALGAGLEALMAGCSAKPPRTVLEHLIRQVNRTYEELHDDFEKMARQLGEDHGVSLTAHHLRRLASGCRTRMPHPVTCRVLEGMFGRPIGELLRPWPGELTAPAGSADLAYVPPETPRDIAVLAAQRAREFAFLPLASPSAEVLSLFHREVQELARLYSRYPVSQFIARLAAVQASIFTLLEARQVPDQARQLYFLAGVTGGMLARASHDLADPSAALAQAGTAFICAERAGHDGLKGWIRAVQSMIAYWADDSGKAIAFAESARQFTSVSRSTTAVWVPAVEARAWARLGNERKVIELIREAETERARVRTDDLDGLSGICTFGPARQAYCHADALAWLPGQAKACQFHAQQAIDGYRDRAASEWSFTFDAGSRADLTIARIHAGEQDGTAEALGPVLALPPEQRTNPIIKSVKRVQAVLETARPTPSGQALAEEIRAFTVGLDKAIPRSRKAAG
jgi:hypothetical protein